MKFGHVVHTGHYAWIILSNFKRIKFSYGNFRDRCSTHADCSDPARSSNVEFIEDTFRVGPPVSLVSLLKLKFFTLSDNLQDLLAGTHSPFGMQRKPFAFCQERKPSSLNKLKQEFKAEAGWSETESLQQPVEKKEAGGTRGDVRMPEWRNVGVQAGGQGPATGRSGVFPQWRGGRGYASLPNF